MACLLEKFRFLQNREVCDVSRLRFQRMIGTALSPEGHRFPSRTKRLIELRNDVLRAEAPACKLKVHHGGTENTARPRRNQPLHSLWDSEAEEEGLSCWASTARF